MADIHRECALRDGPSFYIELGDRVSEAIKNPALLKLISKSVNAWNSIEEKRSEQKKAEAEAELNKKDGVVHPWAEYPIPLPDLATDEEKCVALAAIHNSLPSDVK